MLTEPTPEGTYYTGVTLDLHTWGPPARPDIRARYERDRMRLMVQLTGRYSTSVAERATLPSTPPAISITLERRLLSSIGRVPHVWTAHVQGGSPHAESTPTESTVYPPLLVAKIYDPVFFDDDEAQWFDPFALRDLGVSSEVEAYERLTPLQGTKVPRFYGHFMAALPSQDGRTVNVILLEYVPGKDMRVLVPGEEAEKICGKHREAVIDTALRLFFDILAYGVRHTDMQPRNVIVRPQQKDVAGMQYCTKGECLLCHEVDCNDLGMVVVDFEIVDFKEPDNSLSSGTVTQQEHVDRAKPQWLARWLENAMI